MLIGLTEARVLLGEDDVVDVRGEDCAALARVDQPLDDVDGSVEIHRVERQRALTRMRARSPVGAVATRSSRSGSSQHDRDGARQDVEIEPRRPVAHVLDVERDAALEGRALRSVTCQMPGETRLPRAGRSLPSSMSENLALKIGPWADQAHVSDDHVPQLGQFVEAVLA